MKSLQSLQNAFSIGDKIKCIWSHKLSEIKKDDIYTVKEVSEDGKCVTLYEVAADVYYSNGFFELYRKAA